MDQSVWERVKQGLRDGAALSMEKIEEYTKIGKLKLDEMAAKRRIDRNFADIGQVSFDLLEAGHVAELGDDPVVKQAVQAIKELRQELVEISAQIQQIQDEARKQGEARAAAREEDEVAGV